MVPCLAESLLFHPSRQCFSRYRGSEVDCEGLVAERLLPFLGLARLLVLIGNNQIIQVILELRWGIPLVVDLLDDHVLRIGGVLDVLGTGYAEYASEISEALEYPSILLCRVLQRGLPA